MKKLTKGATYILRYEKSILGSIDGFIILVIFLKYTVLLRGVSYDKNFFLPVYSCIHASTVGCDVKQVDPDQLVTITSYN